MCELSKKSNGVNGVRLSEAQAGRLIAGVGSDSPLITSNGALGSAVSSPSRVRAGGSPGRSTISLYSEVSRQLILLRSQEQTAAEVPQSGSNFMELRQPSGARNYRGLSTVARVVRDSSTKPQQSGAVQPLLQKPVIGFVNISYLWLLV